jgi:hypothetical protein
MSSNPTIGPGRIAKSIACQAVIPPTRALATIAPPSQLGHGRAAGLKSANAINRDRPVSRQLLDLARQGGRSVHKGSRQHVSASGQVPRQTEIQKYRSTIFVLLKRGLQLLGLNPRLCLRRRAEGEEELVLSRSFADCQAIPRAYPFPIQVCPRLIDIGSRPRAKIEMIGVLVHVEQKRTPHVR